MLFDLQEFFLYPTFQSIGNSQPSINNTCPCARHDLSFLYDMPTHSLLTTARRERLHHIILYGLEIAKYISNFSQKT